MVAPAGSVPAQAAVELPDVADNSAGSPAPRSARRSTSVHGDRVRACGATRPASTLAARLPIRCGTLERRHDVDQGLRAADVAGDDDAGGGRCPGPRPTPRPAPARARWRASAPSPIVVTSAEVMPPLLTTTRTLGASCCTAVISADITACPWASVLCSGAALALAGDHRETVLGQRLLRAAATTARPAAALSASAASVSMTSGGGAVRAVQLGELGGGPRGVRAADHQHRPAAGQRRRQQAVAGHPGAAGGQRRRAAHHRPAAAGPGGQQPGVHQVDVRVGLRVRGDHAAGRRGQQRVGDRPRAGRRAARPAATVVAVAVAALPHVADQVAVAEAEHRVLGVLGLVRGHPLARRPRRSAPRRRSPARRPGRPGRNRIGSSVDEHVGLGEHVPAQRRVPAQHHLHRLAEPVRRGVDLARGSAGRARPRPARRRRASWSAGRPHPLRTVRRSAGRRPSAAAPGPRWRTGSRSGRRRAQRSSSAARSVRCARSVGDPTLTVGQRPATHPHRFVSAGRSR